MENIEISAEEFNEYVDRLEKENEALLAQVEMLRSSVQAFSFSFVHEEEAKDLSESTLCRFADLQGVVVATPAQCLAEIEAKAGRAGFIAGVKALERARSGYETHFDVEFECEHYSEQLRQAAKGK